MNKFNNPYLLVCFLDLVTVSCSGCHFKAKNCNCYYMYSGTLYREIPLCCRLNNLTSSVVVELGVSMPVGVT